MILSQKEVAAMLGVRQNTLANWRRRGHFPDPDFDKPRRPLWLPETVHSWMAEGENQDRLYRHDHLSRQRRQWFKEKELCPECKGAKAHYAITGDGTYEVEPCGTCNPRCFLCGCAIHKGLCAACGHMGPCGLPYDPDIDHEERAKARLE